jgi:hypothetical protein
MQNQRAKLGACTPLGPLPRHCAGVACEETQTNIGSRQSLSGWCGSAGIAIVIGSPVQLDIGREPGGLVIAPDEHGPKDFFGDAAF